MSPLCRCLLALLCGALPASLSYSAIERLPIADFARTPEMSRVRLSPDGRRIAFLREFNALATIHVMDLETRKITRINLGSIETPMGSMVREANQFDWLTEDRLLVTAILPNGNATIVAAPVSGGALVAIAGTDALGSIQFVAPQLLHIFDDDSGSILAPGKLDARLGGNSRYDVLKVDTTNGQARVVAKNPKEVAAWGVDGQGRVRAGLLSHGDLKGMLYREDEKAEWRTVLPLADRDGMRPLGFDPANDGILMVAPNPARRWAVYRLDPRTGEMGEPLVSDDEYDIIPERSISSIDGSALSTPLFSPRRDALLGIRYLTDAPRVRWFDARFAAYQKAMDRTRPDLVNIMIDASRDMKRVLWLGFSDQHPGTYFLLDTDKRSIAPIGSRMEWIDPAKMAPMHAIHYAARDGTRIHGYLTVPAGHRPEKLPLVVMPHGGPWVRDAWGFNPIVQAIANRGYAVLQMNYRGSPGYGITLYRSARRQIGRAIQDDIEDATRWAIDTGVADPKRIAIAGASYGGYSTLFALGKSPGLYRCGVAIAAVSDWPAIFDDRRNEINFQAANRYWRREIGDPDKDEAFLRSISPVNFAAEIGGPLLIIHGKEDAIVPLEQAKLMIEALEGAGKKPRSVIVPRMGHDFGSESGRRAVIEAAIGFVEEHLGPGLQ
jgi:dipeptidyl aminopeptidase/acylaminoacyl peptidase